MTAALDVGFLSLDAELIDEINDAFLNTHVSVSGSRYPLPTRQATTLLNVLTDLHNDGPRVLHHGLCTGADEIAHQYARVLHWQIHGHPGPASRWQMPVDQDEYAFLHPVKPFPVRDKDIAVACGQLVAVPAFPEHHWRSRRSGTWLTVGLARDLRRPVTFVWPDGSTNTEGDHHA